MTKEEISEEICELASRMLDLAKATNNTDLEIISLTIIGASENEKNIEELADVCAGYCNYKLTERQIAEN